MFGSISLFETKSVVDSPRHQREEALEGRTDSRKVEPKVQQRQSLSGPIVTLKPQLGRLGAIMRKSYLKLESYDEAQGTTLRKP